MCNKCQKKGHFAKVCRSSTTNKDCSVAVGSATTPNTVAACPSGLSQATISVTVNGQEADALIDTGSTNSFINKPLAAKCNTKIYPIKGRISMASSSMVTDIEGTCYVD